jgi:hypothetical protein
MPARAQAFAGFFVRQDASIEVARRDTRDQGSEISDQEASQQRAGFSAGMTIVRLGLRSFAAQKALAQDDRLLGEQSCSESPVAFALGSSMVRASGGEAAYSKVGI